MVGFVAVVSCGENGIGPELARRLADFRPLSDSVVLIGAGEEGDVQESARKLGC
jgi:hypothetical protein